MPATVASARLPHDLERDPRARPWSRLSEFAQVVTDGIWQPEPHLTLLAEYLEALVAGYIRRLIIEMPPRHGKSWLTSWLFPTWVMGNWPDSQIILCSYGAKPAAKWGRICRDTLRTWGRPLWGDRRVRPDVCAADLWQMVKYGGVMRTAGTGGPITGEGANYLLIDDPVKSSEAAYSLTQQESVWEWWRGTARTRLEPDGRVVLTMTRWSEGDLAGRILEDEDPDTTEPWYVLRLPAVAEDDPDEPDLLDRAPGEALSPRWPIEVLRQIERDVGPWTWSAEYQQRPIPVGGGVIQKAWFHYWQDLPSDFDDILQSWDMSFGARTDTASWVVGQVWARRGADLYLLDQVRGRWEMPECLAQVEALARKWPGAILKLVEAKANGPAVVQMLKHTIGGFVEVEPETSKLARLQAVAPIIESGNVYLPQLAHWLEDFVGEVCGFPGAARDDQVDAMSQALARLLPKVMPTGRERDVPSKRRHDGGLFPPQHRRLRASFDTGEGYEPQRVRREPRR